MGAVSKKKKRLESLDIISFLLVTLLVIIIVFPFYVSIVTAFTTNASYIKKPVQLIPESFTIENFRYVFEHLDILLGYKNTIVVAFWGTIISMVSSLMYAYALSMDAYPGKKLAMIIMLITMYFNGGLIPTYLLIKNLGLINNKLAIVFLGCFSPFYIIIMKNGIQALPSSVIDAARIDGAGEFKIFLRIVVPLVKPVAVTFTLFTIVGYWNEYYWSMIILTKNNIKTLQIMLRTVVNSLDSKALEALSNVQGIEVFSQGLKMAAVVITMLPIMVLYPFLQKHFAAGMLVGAIKM